MEGEKRKGSLLTDADLRQYAIKGTPSEWDKALKKGGKGALSAKG